MPKYFLYARKSSEDKKRQILSIPSQIRCVKEKFPNLQILEVIQESKSAFSPYNRPEFTRMIDAIQQGKADGIVAWHPNRLSRNEVDAGQISFFVRTGIIKDLKFVTYTFENTAEGILQLQSALSYSQYESSKLSREVKRGLGDKFIGGGHSGPSPEGYKNNYKDKSIEPDPERFPLIRKAWDMLLYERISPALILDTLNNVYHYRTIKRNKIGGKPLSLSGLYKIFKKKVYFGINENVKDGKEFLGSHEKMITEEEYWLAQSILGRNGTKRPHTKNLMYSGGLFKCSCEQPITAEEKYIVVDNKPKRLVYYRCTKRNRCIKCTERTLEETVLEAYLESVLDHVTVPEPLFSWALKYIQEYSNNEIKIVENAKVNLTKHLADLNSQLPSLIDMRIKGLINDDMFKDKKNEIEMAISKSQKELNNLSSGISNNLVKLENCYTFAHDVKARFFSAPLEVRRSILIELTEKRMISAKSAYIELKEEYGEIKRVLSTMHWADIPLEPSIDFDMALKNAMLEPIISQWLGDRDSNPNTRDQNP